jgi:hypothetical protein
VSCSSASTQGDNHRGTRVISSRGGIDEHFLAHQGRDHPGHDSRPLSPQASARAPTPAKSASASVGIPANPANAAWDRREEVDVEAVLTNLSGKNPQKLNWRTSIVDLMKLLDIDSSLANRMELAQELGFTGDTNDSATMNTWLHKRVMQELEKNGGKVPASLVA